MPPQNITKKLYFKKENYIQDFYTNGGTENLLKKINNNFKKKKIIIAFIGSKAGLLEPMLELETLINKEIKTIKILGISSSKISLEKAILSKNYQNYKFLSLISKNILKLKSANQIYSLIEGEFKNCKRTNF